MSKSEVQGSFGLGEAIPGIGVIDRIGWVSVDVIDATGRRGRITLVGQPAAGRGGAGAATPDAAVAADPWADRIKKIDDHTFEVDRGLVRELVGGSVKPGSARVAPVTTNGKLDGLRLYGVQAGSLPAALGLRNSDVLSAINNTKIDSVNTLLGVYTQLDQLNIVEFAGTRGAAPLGITLRLR